MGLPLSTANPIIEISMNQFGRFLAGSVEGIEEVRDFAHRGGCFVSIKFAKSMAGCWYVTVWGPPICRHNKSDARSLSFLNVLEPMIDADLWD